MNATITRLIEADLPIKQLSLHSVRSRRKREGNLSSLHFWWARRPIAACRAIILASLLPDPVNFAQLAEQQPALRHAQEQFSRTAVQILQRWRQRFAARTSPEVFGRLSALENSDPEPHLLRALLLDFISQFADWDNGIDPHYIEMARLLAAAAHRALYSEHASQPLLVDPFAGGGAIPLEALRVGLDVFASDLNPVAVLINKVIVEDLPKFGEKLAPLVRKWGDWLIQRTRASLELLYPKGPEGSTPVAYFWARTIRCTAPNCGATIPLLSRLQVTKREKPPQIVHLSGGPGRALEIGIRSLRAGERVSDGTARGGTITCPFCFSAIGEEQYRNLASRGHLGEVLYGVVFRSRHGNRRIYRSATTEDKEAFERARKLLSLFKAPWASHFSTYPDEPISPDEPRRLNIRQYGLLSWGQLFNDRQKYALATMSALVVEAHAQLATESSDPALAAAIARVLALSVSNLSHYLTNVSTYLSDGMISAFIQSSAIAMRSDYAEANPLMDSLVGGLSYQIDNTLKFLEREARCKLSPGTVQSGPAQDLPLPDNVATLCVTDPPYYYSIPYADLSDIFYVWLKRMLYALDASYLQTPVTPKDREAIQNLPHSKSPSKKDRAHYERELAASFARLRSTLVADGIAVVVFAHASTEGWEALIGALISAGWTITASWPIDTENTGRMLANRQRTLSSSIHLVCRPRDPQSHRVGDWREVLAELPGRIRQWMPRLESEGIVGADAIFACLGPALEIFSRYDSVERPSGELVTLREYLEHVWAAVAKEALATIFKGADATGFEEDSRLTAMWLWTLSTGANGSSTPEEKTSHDEQDNDSANTPRLTGFSLEYDAARKIAQGLGAHIEALTSLVEIKGDTARLLPVAERVKPLFGKDEPASGGSKRKKKAPQLKFSFEAELEEAEQEAGWGKNGAPRTGQTVLDRLHQAMILFGAGRTEAIRRFLIDEGVGRDERFWRLAQALAALYPPATDERRWVEGVLARKKGLGL